MPGFVNNEVQALTGQIGNFDFFDTQIDYTFNPMIFRSSTNGLQALQMQTLLGAPVFNLDTFNQRIGINTDAPDKALEINSSTGSNLRLTYNDANGSAATYTDFDVSSVGNLTITPAAGGNILSPSQARYLASKTGTTSNVTGDGTNYQVIFDTEIYDVGSNYNNASGLFTGPLTGKYLFCTSIMAVNLGVAHTNGILSLVTSNGTYFFTTANYGAIKNNNDDVLFVGTIVCDIDAADTAYVNIQVSNSTKTVGVYGASRLAYFSGNLIG